MKNSDDKPRLISRGVILPAAAVGAGLFGGSVVGATLARGLSRTPGMVDKLRKMTPKQRKKFLRAISLITSSVGGAAGAGASGISYAMLQRELEKKKAIEKKAMYDAFFDELRRL